MKQETLITVPSLESEKISVRIKVYTRLDMNVGENFFSKTRVFNVETKQSEVISVAGKVSKKINGLYRDVHTKQPKLLITYEVTPDEDTTKSFKEIIAKFENDRDERGAEAKD